MRLLITLDFPPDIGGIPHYLYGIVRHTYGENDRVFVAGSSAAAGDALPVTTPIRRFRSPLDHINRKWSLLSCAGPFLTLCTRFRGNLIIECGNVYAAFIPWLFSPLTKQPYAVYTYGSELLAAQKLSVAGGMLRRILGRAETLYTLGPFSERILRGMGLHQHIVTVPPRIELPAVTPSRATRNTGVTTVLCVGRLVQHKGHETLIRAAEILAAQGDYRIRILGDGPEYARLTALCAGLKLASCVTIQRGLADDRVAAEYAAADLFAFPSLETPHGVEGFGIVLLEAMACRLPIVASNAGGIAAVLDNGNCGLLVAPGDPAALAEGIGHLADTPSLARALAENAYTRLRSHYVWS